MSQSLNGKKQDNLIVSEFKIMAKFCQTFVKNNFFEKREFLELQYTVRVLTIGESNSPTGMTTLPCVYNARVQFLFNFGDMPFLFFILLGTSRRRRWHHPAPTNTQSHTQQ